MNMVSAREIVGKRIVAFDPGAAKVGYAGGTKVMHGPTITLDDGSRLIFHVEEHPEGCDYGVKILRRKR